MDFALILVVATAVAGVVWAFDVLFLRSRRLAAAAVPGAQPAREPVLVEYARSFFPILLLVLVIRSFLFEPFRIPSSSMLPTLLVGDFIFVNKFTYGLRLPVANTKFLSVGEPERGDVIVFRLPSDPSTNFIKRLVGLPGDQITYVDGRVYVNGQPMAVEPEGMWQGPGQPPSVLARENLGGREHDVLFIPGRPSLEGTFVVPQGHYFMMGDNRDNSRDSRYPGVGFIPEDHIVGKAVRIWMNWDFPAAPQWRRIGDAIR